MSGHTAGPWAYEYENADYSGGGCWYAIKGPDGGDLLWYPYNGPRSGGEREEANARLMAAAPELLAEVEREYETLADIRNEWAGRYTPQGQAKLCRLRDLIAKATGRTEQDVQDDFGNRAIARIAKATGASE